MPPKHKKTEQSVSTSLILSVLFVNCGDLIQKSRMTISLLLFIGLFTCPIQLAFCVTDPRDAAALQSLKDQWLNTPPSWDKSDDPCGAPWEGVACDNIRITALSLSTMGLKGKLSGDIGGLTELRTLDFSFNKDLRGSLTPRLGDLKKLNILILAGCGFTGGIPDSIGNLAQLSFLALNSNNLTGGIPASLGKLSKLYWLDLAENQLSGTIPISTPTSPGLDQLLHAKHFHFSKNQLSGPIPPKLFSAEMVLIHILFDANQFNGTIPDSLGQVETLEVLRLDRNDLTGNIPSNISNLVNINELNLANNRFTGSLPNLANMINLNYVDLSNNSFDPSIAPAWFSTLVSISTLIMESTSLEGPVPQKLFSYPQIEQVLLRNNSFNETLNMGDTISPQLQLVDLEDNQITSVTLSAKYTNTLLLIGNPVCSALSNTNYCQLEQLSSEPYSTSLANCGHKLCPPEQKLSPQSCECAFPLEGSMYFRGPPFRDVSNANKFRALEMSLWVKLGLTPGSIYIHNPSINEDDYLQVPIAFFPPTGKYFNRSEIQRIGFDMSNQTYKPPQGYGPYYFIATPYPFPVIDESGSISGGAIAGIGVGGGILLLSLVGMAFYAFKQKQRAERAIGLSKPFASWAANGKESGGAPQLKGARWFSYDELKKCTGNFSEMNEIGSGGYGKVYRGMLSDGQVVAIKRAQLGSMQGGVEFKTEIELLSRVHHKNLVGLVGFCFEQGQQMLVYEFMANGTLRESLSGKSGIYLDWKRRLRIALGSARGLAYLHELANPPIIHRDVKSTNILLDENLTAKVADFGLSKLVSDSTKGHVSTQVKGTLGYLDPEYYMTQQLTEKSDVYSFGVVMLEVVTGRQPIEKGKYVVREMRRAMEKKSENEDMISGIKEKMDPGIRNMGAGMRAGFDKFLELALQCVEDSASHRPTMSEVVKGLEIILHNDGINTDSTTSAASSGTDFTGGSRGGSLRHPYHEMMMMTPPPTGNNQIITSTDHAFDYSGGFSYSAKVEPK